MIKILNVFKSVLLAHNRVFFCISRPKLSAIFSVLMLNTIKTAFFSPVAYFRSVLDKYKGFVLKILFRLEMIYVLSIKRFEAAVKKYHFYFSCGLFSGGIF